MDVDPKTVVTVLSPTSTQSVWSPVEQSKCPLFNASDRHLRMTGQTSLLSSEEERRFPKPSVVGSTPTEAT